MARTLRKLIISVTMYSAFVTGVVLVLYIGQERQRYRSRKGGVAFVTYDNTDELLLGLDINVENNIKVNVFRKSSETITPHLVTLSTVSTTTRETVSTNSSQSRKRISNDSNLPQIPVASKKKPRIVRGDMKRIQYMMKNPCPDMSPMLTGRIKVNAKFQPTEEQAIKAAGFEVSNGCYEPTYCNPDQTLAVIVPYKNREQHLRTLMYNLHPILQRQWLRYCIFVTEQYDDGAFNKARVMNAGFLEIMKDSKHTFDCLIFHDVDMLLQNDRNVYKCATTPKHLSPAIDKFDYKINYGTHFGGVGAVSVDNYLLVNGHSNRFYGWGGEDSDIEKRYKLHNLKIVTNEDYGRYKMIPHTHPWYFNPLSGLGSFVKWSGTSRYDDPKPRVWAHETDESGLSSIRYSVQKVQKHKLYTKIMLDVRTFLVNSASLSFTNHSDMVQVENPWFTNQRLGANSDRVIRGFGVETTDSFPNYDCEYKEFNHKTVNMTLGYRAQVNATYNVTYHDLEEAKAKCNELVLYCGSIIETAPGNYSLRSTALMDNNVLTYKLGRYPSGTFTERQDTVSVHVKICPLDVRSLHFISNPVLMPGTVGEGPEPTHQVDAELQIYKVENVSLNYTVKFYPIRKAIKKEMEAALNVSLGIYDSLSDTYRDSVFILNMTDENSTRPFLPENIETLRDLEAPEGSVLRIRTPPIKFPRVPGCYICESSITDQNGSPFLKWKWWFELRGASNWLDKQLMRLHRTKTTVRSTEFTEAMEAKVIKGLSMFPSNFHLTDDIIRMLSRSLQMGRQQSDNLKKMMGR